MSLITRLPLILKACRAEFEAFKAPQERGETTDRAFRLTEMVGGADPTGANILAAGDNAAFMEFLLREKGMAGQLKLIYVDPPYFSNANYQAGVKVKSGGKRGAEITTKQNAYHDLWDSAEEYLAFLTYRLLLMKELLAAEGTIWVHLDWHIVHYVKVIMDEIFGEKNFVNEVIWTYKSGGASKRHFARKHDTLLFYSKSNQYYFRPGQEKSYNRGLKPYHFKGVKEYEDELGWYTMVTQKDVWQIDMVGRTAAERTGYATQKPEPLLARILESCTEEGDLCADFFGGSGTLAAVCSQKNRRFIHCDVGPVAEISAKKRLTKIGGQYGVYRQKEKFEFGGKICTKMTLQPGGESDTIRLGIELNGYQSPYHQAPPVDKKNLHKVIAAMNQNPLSIVDLWCVDWQFDGEVFRPGLCQVVTGEEERIAAEYRGPALEKIAIKVYDVFGGSVMKEFTIS